MKIKKEELERARVALGVVCLAALIISALVVGLPVLVGELGDTYLDNIKTSPPYNFPKADSLLQVMIHRLEQKGLTKGEIDPYFHRFGNMETHYHNFIALQEKIHTLALTYPDSTGAKYDWQFIEGYARPLLEEASTNAYLVELYDMFHNKLWWTVTFFLSFFGIVYGLMYGLSKLING